MIDCAITFSDGGGEIDSSSRSQILQVQASIRYHYFGDQGELGSSGENAIANALNNALSNFGGFSNTQSSGGVTAWGA